MEQELAHAVNASSLALSEALSHKAAGTSEVSRDWECKAAFTQAPWGPATQGVIPSVPQFLSRNMAVEMVLSIKELWAETRAFLDGKAVSEGLESTQSPSRLLPLGVAAGLVWALSPTAGLAAGGGGASGPSECAGPGAAAAAGHPLAGPHCPPC